MTMIRQRVKGHEAVSQFGAEKQKPMPPFFTEGGIGLFSMELINFRPEVSKFYLGDSTVNVCVPDRDASRLQAFILGI
jgi:hypothetical protein